MSRALPRKLEIVSKQKITNNMMRITLGGDDLMTFPDEQEGGYIKLHFAKSGVLNENVLAQIQSDDTQQRPILRTYTVRNQRQDPKQIDVDFVLHDTGLASNWALNSEIGSEIYIAGPGKKKSVDATADWVLIIGDMTALPAISVNLSSLAKTAQGYAVIEILHESDKQNLAVPSGVKLIWVVCDPASQSTALVDIVKSLPKLAGNASAWLACEFDKMRLLRTYIYQDLQIPRRSVYASSYWKQGITEHEHKSVKRADSLSA
ncbi:MAG: NADPH-dependent ferric siderophore reductase [Oceanospirillaceae bacterium]|jgi:NADPH-dependent ferric siderophore reductase